MEKLGRPADTTYPHPAHWAQNPTEAHQKITFKPRRWIEAKKAGSTPKAKKTTAGAPQGLADRVLTVLMKVEGPLRAGAINQALGRPDTAGSRESVRNVLDRLVSANLAERRGRGLYEAA